MDANDVVSLIANVGLPTVAVIYLWKKVEGDNRNYIELLKAGMEDNKKSNEKLLETNAKFAEEIVKINTRMDNMEDDISELDTKIDKILEEK